METQTTKSNSILMITPYRHAGTWVFDDAAVGLNREPFVAGVPEILDDLVKDIPNAEKGFRMLFSGEPFPGYQAVYSSAEAEYGGGWYTTTDGRRGWLCSALFKYFAKAPAKIYVRAEALK